MKDSLHKSIHWPGAAQNKDQEGIEEIHRAIKERRRDSLPYKVNTSEREIVEMATVVDNHGHDPIRFLHILRQDSERFGVQPEDVYENDQYHEGPYWPELGFALTMEELDWLANVCCQTVEHASSGEDRSFQHSPIERLDELCEFLRYAQQIEIPPSLRRGDQ